MAKRIEKSGAFTPKHTVRAFVASLDIASATAALHGQAITKLEEYLGRPAKLSDLTTTVLSDFSEWLAESPGLRNTTRDWHRQLLFTLSGHAAERGIIELPIVAPEHRGYGYEVGDDVSRWGLQRYTEDVFLIDRQAGDEPLTPETIKAYRAAVAAFLRFASGKPSTVHHITSKKVRAFRKWLIDNDMSEKKAGNHAYAVAAIVKHAKPERFMEEMEKLTPAADPQRVLAYVFQNRMLPTRQKITTVNCEKKYYAVFNSFGRFLGKVATLDDLTDEKVGAYMRHLLRGNKKLSAKTINGYRSKLVSIWTWCAKKGKVDQFPTIEKMPEPAAFPVAWTVDELRQLLRGASQMPGEVGGIPAPLWWRTLHYVAWNTGERKGALLALTWQMLDLKTGYLFVPAEFRKGGKKPMNYTLRPETLELLKAMREPGRELIFPFPQASMFYYQYRRLLKLAELPYVRYKSALQKMRRSFATHLEAAGGNATEAFNHGERSTTVNSYLDPRLIERTSPNELLFSLEVAIAGN